MCAQVSGYDYLLPTKFGHLPYIFFTLSLGILIMHLFEITVIIRALYANDCLLRFLVFQNISKAYSNKIETLFQAISGIYRYRRFEGFTCVVISSQQFVMLSK